MDALPTLNLPVCQFRFRKREGVNCIWDAIRLQWLVLTPEEWVRQNFICYLVGQLGVSPHYITQEYPVALGGTAQRADIVVSTRELKPCLVVECKAPEIGINKTVLAQAIRYNSVIGALYIIVTNGQKHHCFRRDEAGQYAVLREFPDLSQFFRV